MARSEGNLLELIESVCERMEDYGEKTDSSTNRKSYIRIKSRSGEAMDLSEAALDSRATASLKFAVSFMFSFTKLTYIISICVQAVLSHFVTLTPYSKPVPVWCLITFFFPSVKRLLSSMKMKSLNSSLTRQITSKINSAAKGQVQFQLLFFQLPST